MLLKVLLVTICGILFGGTIRPPHPPAKNAVVFYKGQPIEYFIRGIAYFGMVVLTAAFSYFATTILILNSSPRVEYLIPYVCPTGSNVAASLSGYSPRFIAGFTLVVIGAILRLWSYHTLGTLFTFEVVITQEHRLVKSGPYAFARHPSYTGVMVLMLGVHFIQFGPGGYVSECNIVSTPIGFLVYVWWACLFLVPLSLLRRCFVEDAQLHKHFADDWVQYREEVSYRLIPYVF
ncbi:hypothetical protein L226DRAFT_493567 [Lentinus tigrinus ALCF2SS1-7]|uniref:Protein-S-isoprenylcysteine O-methyltransferase n=1 Tax=Lentinus tigrinus ALCF2SS1-6 TaxID=1328759 RepID=A0A5C2RWN7_9APHY|nr:hypothetical protein L227DRAFT_511040 [Lentinus tigrinus ALCF2SS1-6]RPD69888.1 hypothetical protein L226DRAFT_493567 [Lentinus tigrinus ALCF2SS1-7]